MPSLCIFDYGTYGEALIRALYYGKEADTSIMSDFELDAFLRMGVPPTSKGPYGGGGADFNQSKKSAALVKYKATGESLINGATRNKRLNRVFGWEEGRNYSLEELWYTILGVTSRHRSASRHGGGKAVDEFIKNTHHAIRLRSKWMEDEFFELNGFPRAIQRRIQDLRDTAAGRDLVTEENKQLVALEKCPWLKK